MAQRTTIDAISAVQPDAANDVVHIQCTTGDGESHLDLRSGALSTLTLGLLEAGKAFNAKADEFSGQPLELTGAGLVTLEDGQVMLELVLDDSLRVVIDIPDRALPALHECLFAIGEIRSGLGVEQANATQH